MLRWRLILGTLIIAALIGLCWLDYYATIPGLWLMPIAIVATVLATKELLDLAALAQLRPLRWTVYCGNLLLVTSSWATMLWFDWAGVFLDKLKPTPFLFVSVVLALIVSVLLVLFGEMICYQKPGGNTANIATGVFALVYVGLMLCLAVQMRIIWGLGALVSWIIVVKLGDIGAYTVGRLFGRKKLAPKISPGKTIVGAFGALLFSLVGAGLVFKNLISISTYEWVDSGIWWGWIVFGLLVGGAGMLGDLFESLLKRDVGVKDSSTWMPGFGGVLDILDSLLLSAPVAWFCWASGLVGR
jgi:phosphatidate cytidylyltransferase